MEGHTHLISIDFGTYQSESGIGFGHPDGPCFIYHWSRSGWEIPTILLLDDEGKFEAFGEEALNIYHRKPEKFYECYLFNRFKTKLYQEKNLTRDVKLRAANGKELPAVKIITITLEHFKNIVLKLIQEQVTHLNMRIQWILIVPTICGKTTKQTIREAATEAGLGQGNDTLKLVHEHEAAAVFCLDEIIEMDKSNLTTDEVHYYLMANCGDQTLDVIVNKLTKRPTGEIYIEEIHQARKFPYGSVAINDEFERMLQRMFQLSADDLKSVKCKHSQLWNNLFKEFEACKCTVDSKKPHDVFVLKFHQRLRSTIENFKSKKILELVRVYKWHEIEWDEDEDELILPSGTMDSLLSPVAAKIIAVLTDILQEPECVQVDKIILVGGFADNSLLFNNIESKFASVNIKVKRSVFPRLAVLEGAILFARNGSIYSQKMSQKLGIETLDEFKPGMHKDETAEKNEIVKQKDQQLLLQSQQLQQENLQLIIRHQEEEIQKKGQQLLQLDREMQQLHQHLREQNQWSRQQAQELQRKDQQLQEKNQQVQQKNQQLQQQREEIQQKDQQIQQLQENQRGDRSTWVVSKQEIRISEKLLGTGGWGSVREGIFRGCKVAVKCIDNEIISPYNLRLFAREMDMAARCRHPNLMQFIAATNEGVPFIVTELMHTSLRRILQQGQLLSNQIITILLGAACGLNYLHKTTPNPILHRDISSANILLNPLANNQWHAKLSDFGSANFMRASHTVNPGNAAYAAPEVLKPEGPHTPAMDVFSFGVLMYEMCSREFPADKPNPSMLNNVKWDVTESRLVGMIRNCLSYEIKGRPSMDDLIYGLNR